jgi:hypothetical protein
MFGKCSTIVFVLKIALSIIWPVLLAIDRYFLYKITKKPKNKKKGTAALRPYDRI